MIKKIAHYIYYSACVILLAWILFSYIDIVSDNNSSASVHSAFNFFNILAEGVTA
jgi:hypothetical protein